MKLIYTMIITTMETLGLVFVSLGLGVLTSWWMGAAGFLIVSGLALLAAAGLSARQQRPLTPPETPGSSVPPVTRSKNTPPVPDTNGTDPRWLARIRKVLST